MKDSTFTERFNRWKNGESYWDIIDKPLAKYGNGKDYDGYNIQHVKQGSLGKDIDALIDLPDVKIIGDALKNKNRIYNSSFDLSGLTNFINTATLGGLNNLSPTQWARRGYDAAKGKLTADSWFNGNNGIVTNKFANEHPILAGVTNMAGDVLGFGLGNVAKKLELYKNLNPLDNEYTRNIIYYNKEPFGYTDQVQTVKAIAKDYITGKDRSYMDPPWERLLLGGGQIDKDTKARIDAWKMYLKLPLRYNTFVPSEKYPGSFTAKKDIDELEFAYTMDPDNVINAFKTNTPIKYGDVDFVNGSGGNLNSTATGLFEGNIEGELVHGGIIQTLDLWDLHPLQGFNSVKNLAVRLFPFLSKFFNTRLGTKISDRIGRLEAGKIFGAKPFNVINDVPVTLYHDDVVKGLPEDILNTNFGRKILAQYPQTDFHINSTIGDKPINNFSTNATPSYKTGKDLLFKTEGLPWQQKQSTGFYNNLVIKQLNGYFSTAQKYMPKNELIALLSKSERPYYRDEYGTHLASRIIPVSNVDPVGEFVVANAILNKPLQGLSSIINNTVTNSAISKAILKNIGNYKSNITPLIRTKIGDIEVDNPLLYYRLGSLEMGDAFNRLGIVESEESGYVNPMFAKGQLWYGIPNKETLEPIPVKDNKWGLDLSKGKEDSPKTDLLVSSPSTKMTGANNHSRKIDISARTAKLGPIMKSPININMYGEDFIELYNKAYYNSELLRGLVTRISNPGGVRRVPEFTGAANKSNTTLYKFEPGYGYKKQDNTSIYKYKTGKDSVQGFVSTFRPLLYNTLLKKGYHTNSMDNMLTQLAWESNYGKSNNAKSNYNYGGVKSGNDYAKYNSPEDFVEHYVDLIHDRYPNAFNSNDLSSYAKALKDNGYYEDSLLHYSSSLNNMKSLRKAIEKERLGNLSKYNSNMSFDLIMSQPQDAIRSYKQDIVLDVPKHNTAQQKQIIYPSYIQQTNNLPNIMDVYSNMINGRPLLNMPGR